MKVERIFNLSNGGDVVELSEDVIYKAYMVLLFEERNKQRLLNDPRKITFSDGTEIDVMRKINKLYITFADGNALEASEDEIRDFHFALEFHKRSGVPLGLKVEIKKINGSVIEIVEKENSKYVIK